MLATPQSVLKEYLEGIEDMKAPSYGPDFEEVCRQGEIFWFAIQTLDNAFSTKTSLLKKEEPIIKKKPLRGAKRNGDNRKSKI
jgi:hypothetical protein